MHTHTLLSHIRHMSGTRCGKRHSRSLSRTSAEFHRASQYMYRRHQQSSIEHHSTCIANISRVSSSITAHGEMNGNARAPCIRSCRMEPCDNYTCEPVRGVNSIPTYAAAAGNSIPNDMSSMNRSRRKLCHRHIRGILLLE